MEPVQTTFRQWEELLNRKAIEEAKDTETLSENQTYAGALAVQENGPGMSLVAHTSEEIKAMSRREKLDYIQKMAAQSNDENINNEVWNINHDMINRFVAKFLSTYGEIPSASRIAEETGISRHCVARHLKEYRDHPQYVEKIDQFRFMENNVISKVLSQAIDGDLKAAKLYLETINKNFGQPKKRKVVKQQNNYIQINGVVISQETLQNMAPEQLKQVEAIFRSSLPQVAGA